MNGLKGKNKAREPEEGSLPESERENCTVHHWLFLERLLTGKIGRSEKIQYIQRLYYMCVEKDSLLLCVSSTHTTVLHTVPFHLWHQMCGFSTHHAILWHQLGVLQFTQFWHCPPGDSVRSYRLRVPQDRPPTPTPASTPRRPRPQVPDSSPGCASDQLAIDWKLPSTPQVWIIC